jgi:hypothetical protein
LIHIKAAARTGCDGGAMPDIREVLTDTIAAARGADWARYRMRLAALREALERTGASEEERVRRHLDTLGAAAPEHDAEGCATELEALGAALGAQALAAQAAQASPAAIDLRGLRPPEPITRIFDALQRSPDAPLRVILPHEPVPLYEMLRQRGFRYSGRARSEGGFELLIERGA